MEEELYRTLDGDGGKKIIFNMARGITEEGRDVKRGAVIKDNYRRLITESKEVLRVWAARSYWTEKRQQGQEEVETAMHKMKKARRRGQMKCG